MATTIQTERDEILATDPDAKPRHRGMTAFLIEKEPGLASQPGLKISAPLKKLGYKGVESVQGLGRAADLKAGMAKLSATETAQEVALEAMRVHGGYGYSLEYPVERLYRDAPLLIPGDGSNEIQQLIIARRLLERHATKENR